MNRYVIDEFLKLYWVILTLNLAEETKEKGAILNEESYVETP